VVERPAIAGDPRFFQRNGPFTLAAVVDAALAEAPSRRLMLSGIGPLQTATPDQVSFLDNRKYASALDQTQAGAVIVHPDMADRVPDTAVAIVTREPYLAWARAATLFFPLAPSVPGVHPSAVVSPDATVDPSAEIGPLAVVGARAEIGPRCRIGPLAMVGDGVVMGRDCRIGAHVTLSHAMLGDRVCLYPGVRVGQDGFGFAIGSEGFVSVPQIGRVMIHDDVEIGSNTTIDRGSMHDTVIGAGTRIDNLVQIAHNVQIGRACVIVSQVGLSGSAILEDQVVFGGQAGLVGHARIGRGARIGAQAGVMGDVPAGADWVGSPAQPARGFFTELATLKRMIRDYTGARRSGGDPGRGEPGKGTRSGTD
jgi:UDP-3-O-[3-hydroxymyristoyl] glucosamine N-acyltransferase